MASLPWQIPALSGELWMLSVSGEEAVASHNAATTTEAEGNDETTGSEAPQLKVAGSSRG